MKRQRCHSVTSVFCHSCHLITENNTLEQRVEIVKNYYKNLCSVRETFRQLRGNYAESSIQRTIAKFEETGSVANRAVPARLRNARSKENIAAVTGSVRENRNLSK